MISNWRCWGHQIAGADGDEIFHVVRASPIGVRNGVGGDERIRRAQLEENNERNEIPDETTD
jgi:hypothetical protein